MAEVFESFAQAMGAGMMMVYACWCCCSAPSCSRSPSCSRCRCRSAAPSWRWSSPQPISLPVVIGILMLMGIVTKNAIMLVDFAVEEMARGVTARRGHRRCRPQARPADRDDDDRDGRRHAAVGAGHRRRRRVPRADGDGGDRRPDRPRRCCGWCSCRRCSCHGRRLAGYGGCSGVWSVRSTTGRRPPPKTTGSRHSTFRSRANTSSEARPIAAE